jgi:long-chain fatty acid transport protein
LLVLTVVIISCVLLFSGSAAGSGFAIIEQSAASAGYAYAGAAATAQDASTIFFNPAGMALQSGNQLQLGGHYIIPTADFTNQGSRTVLTTPLTGDNGGGGGESALVPNLFYMHSFSERLKAGIGITAPYGLATEYDDGWVGRYHALKSELATLNINPSVAYKINDQWSVGAGISFERAEAELTNAIDWGTAIDAQRIALGAPPLGISQALDGKAKVEGDDWGVGANLGLIFEPMAGTRLGVHYRSQIKHKLEGDATFETPAAAAAVAQSRGLVNTTATAEVTLPETVSFSGYHAFNDRWAIVADVTWTKWSRLDELRVKFATGAADSVTTEEWDDTWRYSIGGIFKPMEALELRAGVAFDESPIPNDERRTPRIPDADRTWLTFGGGYQFSPMVRVDLAYGHLFVDNPKINKTATGEDQLRGALVGEYDASVDIISAAVSFQF